MDAYFVGSLGTRQIGAVSVVFPISQVIVGLGMMFGSGAASYISRLLGEKKDQTANHTASTCLLTSLLTGTAAIVISLTFLDPLLSGLGATGTILPYARSYATIYIAGSIFNIFNITMNNIVTAEGATKLTMLAMLTGAGLNAVLDPLLIHTFGMGIEGAAVASVTAQAVNSLIYLWYILRRKGFLRLSPKLYLPDKNIFKEILKIGIPTFVFLLLSSICIGLTNTAASDCGVCAAQCPHACFDCREGRAVWQGIYCEHCCRCIHHCPCAALTLSKKKRVTIQYNEQFYKEAGETL